MILDMTVKEILTKLVDFGYARVRELSAAYAEPKMYTYWYGLTADDPDGYAPGASGTATFTSKISGQVIDLLSHATAGEFVIDSITVGEYEMADGGAIPADCFAPLVQNRFVRFTEFKSGDKLAVKFRRISGASSEREKMFINAKVRSTENLPSADHQEGVA